MFQSWLRRAAFHQSFLEVKCVHVGRTGKEWHVNFLSMILLAERKFLNFFFAVWVTCRIYLRRASKEGVKATKEKKTTPDIHVVPILIGKWVPSRIADYHFVFFFFLKHNYWVSHLGYAQMEWALFRPHSERRDTRKHDLLFSLWTWKFILEWPVEGHLVAQSVKRPTLGFGLGSDLRVVRSSPTSLLSGFALSEKSAWDSLPLPPPLAHPLSLSQSRISK